MVTIEVKETEDKRWGLYVNGFLIGDSKNRVDADFSLVMLRKALNPDEPATFYETPRPPSDWVQRSDS